MIITLNWLKDFVDINISPKELADKLTLSGFEVESVTDLSEGLQHVYVGLIEKITKHPDADKLVVCKLNMGSEVRQIVTGATNVCEGQLVPVATDGANLCNGIQIKRSVIRGVESQGMLCGGDELGLVEADYEGAGINGILILKAGSAEPGTPIDKVLGRDDCVFDISVLANRPDCQSVIGLAKEVAAITGAKFKQPKFDYKTIVTNSPLKLEIEDKKNCNCYIAQVVKGVKVAPSPKWLQDRLRLVGLRPLNNIVDITNYVLWEVGQPMHAFDYAKLAGNKIVVRSSKNEKLVALDGKPYNLDNSMLVIADKDKPIAIAGVMGGLASSVTENTTDVVFEIAAFDKASIRKTGRKLGLRSDASSRYEKGVESALCELGRRRALNLISELKLGEIADSHCKDCPITVADRELKFSYSLITERLGLNIPEKDAVSILSALGIKTTISGGIMQCIIPTIRSDIVNADDVCEEIIRLYGYEHLPSTLIEKGHLTVGGYDRETLQKNKMRGLLKATGAYEVLTLPLISPNVFDKLLLPRNTVKPVVISNPLGQDYSQMRTQMAHSLLTVLDTNLKRRNEEFAIFESARIYEANTDVYELPKETSILGYASVKKADSFLSIKSIVEMIANSLGLTFAYKPTKTEYLHPNLAADIYIGNIKLGHVGSVHPLVLKNYDIDTSVYMFELNLNALPDGKQRKVKPLPKFPSSARDIAVVIDEDLAVGDLLSTIKTKAGNDLEGLELFDIYTGSQVGTGKKSVAFNLVFRSSTSTLTDAQVNGYMDNVLKALSDKFSAKIR